MKYINEFKPDDHIMGHYLCTQKNIQKTKTGKSYLSLTLQDKTGSISSKVWDLHEDIQLNFEANDFIKVDGLIRLFNDDLQMNITKLRLSDENEYDLKNYIPVTNMDMNELKAKLNRFITSVNEKSLAALLTTLFNDKEFYDLYTTHSAGKSMHHSYVGGLLEHSVSVTEICEFMSARTNVNRDLLITASILHDMGKIYELSAFPLNDYTDDGELLGHIIIAANLLDKKTNEIDKFPKQLKSELIHCILSHHGEYEYGSPKLPRTIEAIILHFADNMDAKTKMFDEIVSADTTRSNWTAYNKVFARRLLKPNA